MTYHHVFFSDDAKWSDDSSAAAPAPNDADATNADAEDANASTTAATTTTGWSRGSQPQQPPR